MQGLCGGGCARGLCRDVGGCAGGCAGAWVPQAKGNPDFQKIMFFTRFSIASRDAPEVQSKSKSYKIIVFHCILVPFDGVPELRKWHSRGSESFFQWLLALQIQAFLKDFDDFGIKFVLKEDFPTLLVFLQCNA